MWFESHPGRRLWLVQQCQQEFTRHAESGRLAQRKWSRSTGSCADPDYGLRGWLGRLLASSGRALDPREAPCNDPRPDAAFR